MQAPTPPTKPTPPVPPSMKTSTAVPATDTHAPAKMTSQSADSSTAPLTSKEQSAPIPAVIPESAKNISSQASYNTSNNASTEATSEKAMAPTTNLAKNTSSPTGFSTFFVLIIIIAIAVVVVHWWRNHKPKQRSTVDYSTESSDEIVNLIFSENTLESTTQGMPKTVAKKIVQKAESAPKTKGNFEVRI